MAITHEGTVLGQNTVADQNTLVIPAGVVADDVLFVWVGQGRTADPPSSITDDDTGGNTWALVAGANDVGGNVSGRLYWKRATSGSASKTITVVAATGDPPDSIYCALTVYRGCKTSGDPFENAGASALAAGTESISGITTSAAGSMVCIWNVLANNVAVSSQAATDPATLTERYDSGSTAGSDIEIAHASAIRSTAGATGTISWSHTDFVAVAAWLNLLQPGSGTTYAKVGAVLAGAVGAGGDVFEAAEAGSVRAAAASTGGRVLTLARAGAAAPAAALAGADVFEAAEAGATWAGVQASGADAFTAAESGAVTTQALAAGVATLQASNEFNKAGAAVAGAVAAAADAWVAAESGAAVAGTAAAGPDSTERVEAGAVAAGTSLGGTDQRTSTQAGTVAAGALAAGGRQATFNRAGSVLTAPISAGDADWVSSFRPVVGVFDSPRPGPGVTSSPEVVWFDSPRPRGAPE